MPVLLDTDLGTNLDDALCLAYLLRHPRCELLGVTTVTGQPERRAALARALCRAAGRSDVPVHAGAAAPLRRPPEQVDVPQAEILGARASCPHILPGGTGGPESLRGAPREAHALEFLRATLRARPGEIILLTSGPLTNVARLLDLDPEAASLLRGCASMGGAYAAPERETNFRLDPEAAAVVLAARLPEHRLLGLETTRRCRLPEAEFRARLRPERDPLHRLLADLAEIWFRQRDEVVFHDPLAAASLFRPDLCRWEPGRATVSPTGEARWEPHAPAPPHRRAAEVEAEAFFGEYFGVVGR